MIDIPDRLRRQAVQAGPLRRLFAGRQTLILGDRSTMDNRQIVRLMDAGKP
jgi:hypothetical protein